MSITIRTLSSIGILAIDGTTQNDRVSVTGAREIQAVIGPTVNTLVDTTHLVVAIVDGSEYAIAFVEWTQAEIDSLTTKTAVLTGATDIPQTASIVVEVDPQG